MVQSGWVQLNMRKYSRDEWNWKLRVAFLVILAHMVTLVLPFFSVIFLLMDILGEGTSPGHIHRNQHQGLMEGLVLILMIVTFFSEMIASQYFSKLVMAEVFLMASFILISYDSWGPGLRHTPILIVLSCTAIKICCAMWSEGVESAKKSFLRKRPSNIV